MSFLDVDEELLETERELTRTTESNLVDEKGREMESKIETKRTYTIKADTKKVKYVAHLYNISFQRLLANGNKDISRYILADSNYDPNKVRTDINLRVSNYLSYDEKRILIIDLALLALTQEEAKIIRNDFFFPQAKKWWANDFSRSSYYRTRNAGIKNFAKVCTLCDQLD